MAESKFRATKAKVSNRGFPPDSFLQELVDWGKTAPTEIFAPNPNPADIYASVKNELGPWQGIKHRRTVMLEVLRVLAGFESAWNWTEGRDTTNKTSITPDTIEAGAWQVSANAMNFGQDLRDLITKEVGSRDGNKFQSAMKSNHKLAMTFIAMLLRHTVRHNGPALRKEIHAWLSKASVREFQDLVASGEAKHVDNLNQQA